VKERRNVTLSLPEPLIRKFRVFAASRNQSMTSLMAEAIGKLMDERNEKEKAKARFLERIRNPPDLGTHGVATWTREDMHER
jgi:hypothetical protein